MGKKMVFLIMCPYQGKKLRKPCFYVLKHDRMKQLIFSSVHLSFLMGLDGQLSMLAQSHKARQIHAFPRGLF